MSSATLNHQNDATTEQKRTEKFKRDFLLTFKVFSNKTEAR